MKFPAICTLISTGKLVVCQDAGSFSNKSLVYGFAIGEEPVVQAVSQSEVVKEQPEVTLTTTSASSEIFTCSKCGKICASNAGRAAHERKCNPTA